MSRLARLRISLRIARRSSLRSPGRSALVVALIALPVAGMAAVMLVLPSTIATTSEKLTIELGHTQASVQIVADPNAGLEQDPTTNNWASGEASSSTPARSGHRTLDELFPAGTRLIPVADSAVTLKTRGGVGTMNTQEGETWDKTLRGAYAIIDGRAPNRADEVLATSGALSRLGVQLGGHVELLAPVARTVTVVGEMDDRAHADSTETLYGLPSAFGDTSDLLKNPQATAYLPDTVIDWNGVKALNKQGALVYSRAVLLDPPKPSEYNGSFSGSSSLSIQFVMAGIIVAFALLEVTLLAGAAFMVGARAQERSLATVASVGAPRSTLLSIITANGVVLGAVGGVIGVGAGIGIGSLFMVLTDDGNATRYWGYHLWWPAMIGIAFAAIVIGWIGALVPAVRASRIDIVAALRGARRPTPIRRRRPVFGLILVVVGFVMGISGGALLFSPVSANTGGSSGPLSWVITGMLIGGPILIQLGLILCSGLMLRVLARLFSRAGVASRLAARDAARNPGRSVPALAVVMTTVFVAVFAMAMISSSETTNRANYQYRAAPGQARLSLNYWGASGEKTVNAQEVVAATRSSLDVAQVASLEAVPDPASLGFSDPSVPPADPGLLLPALTLPAANECPAASTGANYNADAVTPGTKAYEEAQADWRCEDHYARSDMSGDGSRQIWVGDAGDLALVIGTTPSADALATLAGHGAVALHPQYVNDHHVTISWWPTSYWAKSNGEKPPPATKSTTIDAVVQKTTHSLPYGIFISPATAHSLGLDYNDQLVLASTKTPVTQDQIDALNQAIDVIVGVPGGFYTDVERGPAASAGAWAWALLGLAGLIAIGAAAVAIGLARADGRKDQAALTAVGASPRVRRGFGFWQAVVLTGTGAVLGAAVGLVPALALTLPGSGTTFTAPWLQIGATAVLMPLVIAGATWVFTGRGRSDFRRAAIE